MCIVHQMDEETRDLLADSKIVSPVLETLRIAINMRKSLCEFLITCADK